MWNVTTGRVVGDISRRRERQRHNTAMSLQTRSGAPDASPMTSKRRQQRRQRRAAYAEQEQRRAGLAARTSTANSVAHAVARSYPRHARSRLPLCRLAPASVARGQPAGASHHQPECSVARAQQPANAAVMNQAAAGVVYARASAAQRARKQRGGERLRTLKRVSAASSRCGRRPVWLKLVSAWATPQLRTAASGAGTGRFLHTPVGLVRQAAAAGSARPCAP
jgi:hypothetical protein